MKAGQDPNEVYFVGGAFLPIILSSSGGRDILVPILLKHLPFFILFDTMPPFSQHPLREHRMPRADQPIRQWTILKLLESNGQVTLRQITDALSEACHEP